MYATREAVISISQQRRAKLIQQADAHRLARTATARAAVSETTTVVDEHPQRRGITDRFGSLGGLPRLIKHRDRTAATTTPKPTSPPRAGRQAA